MRIALVTGAGVRIGKGIAENMLAAGYYLILHANTSFEALEEWVLNSAYKNQVLKIVQADLADASGQEKLVLEVKKIVGHLDVLVNNASLYYSQPFENIKRPDFQKMQAVNLEAPFFITQLLLPLLKKGRNPSVIFITDALWNRPSPKFAHYHVGKAGLAILTMALARELAPSIRVNAVAPGAILFASFIEEKARQRVIAKIPLQRLGTVQDIGDAVVFLAQESSTFSGETFVVDGGRSLSF